MTIDAQIISARYDLRDENSTQYPNALLLDYFNRALRVLDSYLANTKSDWVLSLDTTTLLTDDNSIALPSDFSSTRKVMISTSDTLTKKTALEVLEMQQEETTGTPSYYAEHKTNLIFDKIASADLTINTYYNLKSTVLVTTANMPFNGEFNDSLRGAVVMMAKSRNNRDIIQDHALYQFFQGAEASKNLKRSYAPKTKLGY